MNRLDKIINAAGMLIIVSFGSSTNAIAQISNFNGEFNGSIELGWTPGATSAANATDNPGFATIHNTGGVQAELYNGFGRPAVSDPTEVEPFPFYVEAKFQFPNTSSVNPAQ